VVQKCIEPLILLVEPVLGFEPRTDGLQNRCSTTELNWPKPLSRSHFQPFSRSADLHCVAHLQSVMAAKQTKSNRKRSWPSVYSRKHRSGQAGCVVDLGRITGKPKWLSFKTSADANTFAEVTARWCLARSSRLRKTLGGIRVTAVLQFHPGGGLDCRGGRGRDVHPGSLLGHVHCSATDHPRTEAGQPAANVLMAWRPQRAAG
jgi:hypothetical protein